MKRVKAFAVLNAISFLIQVCFAWLVQQKLVNTKDVAQISNQYFSLFTPADFTFAIWGIIYTGLGIFCLYHIIHAFKRDQSAQSDADLLMIGPLFIISNLSAAAWLFAWTHNQLFLSVILIGLQLLSLALIHFRLRIHRRQRSPASKAFTEFPLSIYLGWICIATLANISVYLVSTGWDRTGISPLYWNMIMIGTAILIGMLVIFTRRNLAFGAVIIWGLYGISARLQSLNNDDYKNTINICWGGIALLGLSCLIELGNGLGFKKRKRKAMFQQESLK